MDQPDSVWTPADHGKFTRALEKCLKHYQWLAKNCFMNGMFRYSLVQKFHLTAHMPTLSQWMNPRMSLCLQQNRIFVWFFGYAYCICQHQHALRTWCYGAESYQGVMKHLASSCVYSTPGEKLPQSMLGKYRFLWDLVLRKLIQLDEE